MRVWLTALFAAVLFPSAAAAQATVYVCTIDGKVLEQRVDAAGAAAGTTVLLSGADPFDDCVIGPDGWLYASSGRHVLRMDPSSAAAAAATAAVVNPTPLPSPARGLAFNVRTLYVSTAAHGLWTITGQAGVADPLTFPAAPAPLLGGTLADGRGVVFDVLGNLVSAADGTLRRTVVAAAPPFYTGGHAPVHSAAHRIYGVAVNTCGEVVFADRASASIRRRLKDGTIAAAPVVSFTDGQFPVAVEIDASNVLYIVTARGEEGEKAQLWRAAPGQDAVAPLQACASAVPELLFDLKEGVAPAKTAAVSSGDSTAPLPVTSAGAMGVAVARGRVSVTQTFDASACARMFDFGWHTVRLGFTSCATPFSVTIDAIESRPSDVSFTFDGTARAMPYSPLNGHSVQYVLNDITGAQPFPFQAQYGFYTQDLVGMPGVARAASHAPADPFTSNVTSDFWDVGVLDAAGGERGNDFSKRVVFNARPAAASCRATAFEAPLDHGKPLFNSGQTVKIAFEATDGETACGMGGTLRVSIVRIADSGGAPTLDFMDVRSTSRKSSNVMTAQGKKFSFSLDTSGYSSGTYLITIWGDTVAPVTRLFEIMKGPQ